MNKENDEEREKEFKATCIECGYSAHPIDQCLYVNLS